MTGASVPALRSPRLPAMLLLGAAAGGLVLANTPVGPAILSFMHTTVGIPGTVFDLSLAHWINDLLLAVFFFVVAVELRYELTRGQLASPSRALRPLIAATGGVVVPVGVYLAVAGNGELARGWPVPTATDVAFALGVLAVFGSGIPTAIRVFLLALAIIDDIVGIVFIAVLFTDDVSPLALLGAAVSATAFALVSKRPSTPLTTTCLLALAAVTWGFFLASGVHATIAGVVLGLIAAPAVGHAWQHRAEPWVNRCFLPLFAFSSALVILPHVSPTQLSPVFWAILVALPLGKIVGVTGFGWIAMRIRARGTAPAIATSDLFAIGALAGIGFTVSLLMATLAFGNTPVIRDQAILGVLGGSAIATALAAVLVSWRARVHRRRAIHPLDPAAAGAESPTSASEQ